MNELHGLIIFQLNVLMIGFAAVLVLFVLSLFYQRYILNIPWSIINMSNMERKAYEKSKERK